MKTWIVIALGLYASAALAAWAQTPLQYTVLGRAELATPLNGWSASVGRPRCDASGTIYRRPYSENPDAIVVSRTTVAGKNLVPVVMSPAEMRTLRAADFTLDDAGNMYVLVNRKAAPGAGILVFNSNGTQVASILLRAPASVGNFHALLIERFTSGRFLILGTQWNSVRKPPGEQPFGAVFDKSGAYVTAVPANSLWKATDSADRDAANVSLLLPHRVGNLIAVVTVDLRLIELSDSGQLVSAIALPWPSSAAGLVPVAFMAHSDRGIIQFTGQRPNGMQYGVYDLQTGSLLHAFSAASLPEHGVSFGCYNEDGTITLLSSTALYRVNVSN